MDSARSSKGSRVAISTIVLRHNFAIMRQNFPNGCAIKFLLHMRRKRVSTYQFSISWAYEIMFE